MKNGDGKKHYVQMFGLLDSEVEPGQARFLFRIENFDGKMVEIRLNDQGLEELRIGVSKLLVEAVS